MRTLFLVLSILFFAVTLGRTQTPGASFISGQPIDCHMDLGLFGLLGGGMDYHLQGRPIQRYEDFKSVIYPQRDEEASRLIREAEEAHLTAFLFYFSGIATGLDVALNFRPAPILNVEWFDRTATGLVTAQFFWAAGALFDTNAEARKFNAVERYNHVLQGKKEEAWEWAPPQVAWNGQEAQCVLGMRF